MQIVKYLVCAAICLFLLVISTDSNGCKRQSQGQKKAAKVIKGKSRKKDLRKMIGKTVEVHGKAMDSKAGAVLVTDNDEVIYIEGLDYWPDNVSGKDISVTGLLKRKKLIPDPQVEADGTVSQGAQGEQLVLEKAKWKAL